MFEGFCRIVERDINAVNALVGNRYRILKVVLSIGGNNTALFERPQQLAGSGFFGRNPMFLGYVAQM